MLLVSHVGTSVIKCVEEELMTMVNELKSVVDEEVILTFNSKRAVEKLATKGITIPLTVDLLSQSDIVKIMPLHLIGGTDLKYLKNSLPIAKKMYSPLLASNHDCEVLANVLSNILDRQKHNLLVGHGSTDISNKYYHALEINLKSLGFKVTVLTLKDDVSKYRLDNEILLMPLFTVAGHHVQKDIFDKPSSFLNQLLAKDYKVTTIRKGLLSYPEIRQLYINKLGEE